MKPANQHQQRHGGRSRNVQPRHSETCQDLGYAKTADLERSLEDVSRLLMAYTDFGQVKSRALRFLSP